METPARFPELKSSRDLTECGTISSSDLPGEVSTYMVHVDSEGHAYLGFTQTYRGELTPREMEECLQPIPDEDIFPMASEDIRMFLEPVTDNLYVKMPDFVGWNVYKHGICTVADLLKGEVESLEVLSKHPHPNIVRYHGCLIQGGRVRGIVLARCFTTLHNALEGPEELELSMQERNIIMLQITSAVEHLHKLGLAHNDLSPYNIMLDEDKFPYLIDFGSCRPIGTRLMQAGTAGFIDGHSSISDFRHDKVGIEKMKEWLGLWDHEPANADDCKPS